MIGSALQLNYQTKETDMSDKKNKDIEKMLREMGKKERAEYPKNLLDKRRESFIRQLFVNKYFWLIVGIIFLCIMAILFPELLPRF